LKRESTLGATDTVTVNYYASDGLPILLGYDLRNEPHTPSRTAYLGGAAWGNGDGIDPAANPNPNPFAPACVASSTCHDWRLAAERAADTMLGDALNSGWEYPLIFVEGVSTYPTAVGTMVAGPYDWYWWGGNLLGVNGNAANPGAPIVLNAGGGANTLGLAVNNQIVYSGHDYGPAEFQQSWFNTSTCYRSGCSSSSLADVWKKFWAFPNLAGGVNPVWPGHASYPWG
jgi:endoglucanase